MPTDVYGTVAEFPNEKTVTLIRKMLYDNGIDSITVYRVTSAGPAFGVATAIRDVKQAKKLIDQALGRDSMSFSFYDWNDDKW